MSFAEINLYVQGSGDIPKKVGGLDFDEVNITAKNDGSFVILFLNTSNENKMVFRVDNFETTQKMNELEPRCITCRAGSPGTCSGLEHPFVTRGIG